jgi:hypothetical protein
MKTKLIGIIICLLLVGTVLPVSAYSNSTNENISIHEKEAVSDDYNNFTIFFLIGLIDGYEDHGSFYIINFTIAFAIFITNRSPFFGAAIIYNFADILHKDKFKGTLTQSYIIGRIIQLGPY